MDLALLGNALLHGAFASILLGFGTFLINKAVSFESTVPKEVPWIDRRHEPMSYIRAKFRSYTRIKQNIIEAYTKFNKQGRAVAVPIAFGRPQIILPPKYISWIIAQPAAALGLDPIQGEFHAIVRDGLEGDHTVQELLRKDLTQNLDKVLPEINAEISAALDDVFGQSPEWRTVPLQDSMRTVVARVTNRIFVGGDICRNEEFIKLAIGLGTIVMPEIMIQDIIPNPLKNPISYVIKAFNDNFLSGFEQYMLPVVRQRYAEVSKMMKEPNQNEKPPIDLLTWMVQKSIKRGETAADIGKLLVKRLEMANLSSIETSSAASSTAIKDLITEGAFNGYLEAVTAEATAFMQNCNYCPEKKDLQRLPVIEKGIKESLRLQVAFPGLVRQVNVRDGLMLPDGTHLPYGARISVSAYGIHRDDSIYKDADTWNPHRFDSVTGSTTSETDTTADTTANGITETTQQMSNQASGSLISSLPRATETYLAFGLGKRSCPGRFFVTDQLKLIFAHLFSKYEIKPTTAGRKPGILGIFMPNDVQGQLVVRRK